MNIKKIITVIISTIIAVMIVATISGCENQTGCYGNPAKCHYGIDQGQ